MDNKIYIIPANDKPVKFMYKNQSDITCSEVPTTEKEALKYTIINMWANKKITGQQYKTEKGKIRREYLNQVINFISKRNMYNFYIEDLNTAKTIITMKYNMPTERIKNNKFGIIKI